MDLVHRGHALRTAQSHLDEKRQHRAACIQSASDARQILAAAHRGPDVAAIFAAETAMRAALEIRTESFVQFGLAEQAIVVQRETMHELERVFLQRHASPALIHAGYLLPFETPPVSPSDSRLSRISGRAALLEIPDVDETAEAYALRQVRLKAACVHSREKAAQLQRRLEELRFEYCEGLTEHLTTYTLSSRANYDKLWNHQHAGPFVEMEADIVEALDDASHAYNEARADAIAEAVAELPLSPVSLAGGSHDSQISADTSERATRKSPTRHADRIKRWARGVASHKKISRSRSPAIWRFGEKSPSPLDDYNVGFRVEKRSTWAKRNEASGDRLKMVEKQRWLDAASEQSDTYQDSVFAPTAFDDTRPSPPVSLRRAFRHDNLSMVGDELRAAQTTRGALADPIA